MASKNAFALGALRQLLLARKIVPGKKYSETELTKTLGISRTPLREATAVLIREGLLERIPQVGFYVHEFSAVEIQETLELRSAIEGIIVAGLAEKVAISGTQFLKPIDDIQSRLCILSDNGTIEEFLEQDASFHISAAKLGSYNQAAVMIEMLRFRIRLLGHIAVDGQRENIRAVISEHASVLAAIKSGSPDEARRAMQLHLEKTSLRLVPSIQNSKN